MLYTVRYAYNGKDKDTEVLGRLQLVVTTYPYYFIVVAAALLVACTSSTQHLSFPAIATIRSIRAIRSIMAIRSIHTGCISAAAFGAQVVLSCI